MTDTELDALLDQVPRLSDRVRVEELSGGLTNRNYRVDTPDASYVVRHSSSDTRLLGIDREAEHLNSRAAAEAGVGAQVFDYRPDLGVLVIGHLLGRTLENDSFGDPAVLGRAAEACRRLHAGPRFTGEFDMLARQAAYRQTVREQGFALPGRYDDHADAWHAVHRALAARPRVTVPCNNDLLAGNFIDDGDRIWLIDYEYSGNNDVEFELGNTVTECEFPPERIDAYVEAYFHRPTAGDRARVRLGALRSEYGWSLWGFIQAATSPLDFDFAQWGRHRYEKAVATFRGPHFDRLLAEAADA
ncbi:phosphotransferase [Nocardioides sp. LHG3406-4]|uniref:phosphotransferase n=1 Tax=Nocardioides sp. LHG3406-4 TaxID=2804575 RepID=UPI003CF802FF